MPYTTGCWPSSPCMPPKPPPMPNTVGSRLVKQEIDYAKTTRANPELPPRRPAVLSIPTPNQQISSSRGSLNRESPTPATQSYEQLLLELKQVQTRRKNSLCSSDDRTSNETSLSGETPSSVSGSEEDVWKVRTAKRVQKKVRFDERPPSAEPPHSPPPMIPAPPQFSSSSPTCSERKTPVILATFNYPFTKLEKYSPGNERPPFGYDDLKDSPTETDPPESVMSSSIGSELDRIGAAVSDPTDPLDAFTELTNMLEASIREISSLDRDRNLTLRPQKTIPKPESTEVCNVIIENQKMQAKFLEFPPCERLPPLQKANSFDSYEAKVGENRPKTPLRKMGSREPTPTRNLGINPQLRSPDKETHCLYNRVPDPEQRFPDSGGYNRLPDNGDIRIPESDGYNRVPDCSGYDRLQECTLAKTSETRCNRGNKPELSIRNPVEQLSLRLDCGQKVRGLPPQNPQLNSFKGNASETCSEPRLKVQEIKLLLPLKDERSSKLAPSTSSLSSNSLSSPPLSPKSVSSCDSSVDLKGTMGENIRKLWNFNFPATNESDEGHGGEISRQEPANQIQNMARQARLKNLELSIMNSEESSNMASSPIYGNHRFPNSNSNSQRPPLRRTGSFNEQPMTETDFDADGYWRKPLRRCGSFRSGGGRPNKPPSFEAVQEWYWSEELPRGSGCDPTTGALAPWFHGAISRQTAEKRLENQAPGTFLVRLTDRLWGYALSVRSNVAPQDGVSHFLVEGLPDPVHVRKYRMVGAKEQPFPSLNDLVVFYSKHNLTSCELLTVPCPREVIMTAGSSWQQRN